MLERSGAPGVAGAVDAAGADGGWGAATAGCSRFHFSCSIFDMPSGMSEGLEATAAEGAGGVGAAAAAARSARILCARSARLSLAPGASGLATG